MNTEKMTVHRALAELKVIDARISKAIGDAVCVVANKHSNAKIGGRTIEAYKEDMRSQYQSVTALISRRNALKRAVVLSNAHTTVEVGGVQYTVAEAIEMKNHGMDAYKSLLRELIAQYTSAMRTINSNSGEAVERKAEAHILAIINAQPKDSKMSADSDAMKAVRADYIANNTYDLVDPLDVAKKIQELDKMISDFETDVDAALSTSNALTVIEFSY